MFWLLDWGGSFPPLNIIILLKNEMITKESFLSVTVQ